MYTTNAYFPSPFDGNYYITYVILQDGTLSPVHFLMTNHGLELVWYQQNIVGTPPTPIKVEVSINNGFSNLVYFQPQSYGTTQQLFCTAVSPQHMVILINSAFQKFEPVEVYDSTLTYQQSNELIPHAAFMQQNPNRMPVNEGTNLPPAIIQALQAVQNGTLPNVNISSNQFGFNLTAEDHQGNRYILEMHTKNGITQKSETTVTNLNDKALRQEQVRQLKAQSMTQVQIANHLGVSQKTISNDLKEMGIS
ncbi:hypothetical protein Q9F25_003314 [Vibrio cholerae]|uniref:hypothetical protein n=1 Tax=Vibrio navarrensis TaxID=29495 RepID=UPI001866F39C|nr:hypothetical protein [Vibrio navarrensis]MBE3655035.1 hypothetical protein [Vibrio navarrensis]